MRSVPEHRTWRLIRAGGGAANPTSIVQRAGTFAAAAKQLGTVTLVTTRDDRGLSSFVMVPPGPSSDQVAMHLAHAVAAQMQEVPSPGRFADSAAVGWLAAKWQQTASRDTQVGADPNEVSRRLVVAMRPGQWLAVTMRAPSNGELRRTRRWYEHKLGRMPVHHTTGSEVMVVSLFAGGDNAEQVRALLSQVTASLPGFDVDVHVQAADLTYPVATCALLTTAATFGGGLGLHHWVWGAAAASVPALISAGLASRKLPSATKRVEEELAAGRFPEPRRKKIPTRRPKEGNTTTAMPGTKIISPSDGDYPLHPTSFLVGPQVVIGVVAPHAGAASGAQATERRSAPAALLEPIGPIIGVAGEDGQPVHLSAEDLFAGVALAGRAGSGKSVAVRSLFAWNCLERVAPSGRPGFPGRTNTLIAFESKGEEGASIYLDWAKAIGDTTLLIEMAEPDSFAIDLFAIPGTAAQRASFFVNAMIYAFGDGAIQDRSVDTLLRVFTSALLVTPQIAENAKLDQHQSPIVYADMLLGGAGDTKGTALAGALSDAAHRASKAGDPGAAELVEAEERLAILYGGKVTESQRRTLCEAPRNKVGQLLEAESWWSPDRRKVTWGELLDQHGSVVLNTGVSINKRLVSDRLTAQMSALLMYSLREAIMRNSSGWGRTGRSVSIFADEVALLAGSSPEVLAWLRNQGRSYGVHPVFAVQYPEQLDGQVRMALMGFDTFLWFAQSNPQIADEAARDMAADGSEWVAADLINLERYTAILRTNVAQQRQPAAPVRMGNWEADMAGYAAAQGYASTGLSAEPW